jgi:phosphoserine phosphatase RsbU/P
MGIGLGVYIASIRIGTSLYDWVVPYSQNNYFVTYLIALAILLLSVLLVHWVSDYEPREVEKRRRMEQLSDYYSEKSEELREARQVQYGMLQSDRHMSQGFQVAAMSETEKEVGGDLYDYIPLDKRKVLFAIGDVTGKGLPAALVMSKMIGLLRSEAHYGHSPDEMLRRINRMLLDEPDPALMVTMGLAIMDRESATLTYASAGHMAPYLFRAGQMESLDTASLPLGIDNELRPWIGTVAIGEGDVLILHTDGLMDVCSPQGELLDFDKFEAVLRQSAGLSDAKAIRANIVEQLKQAGHFMDDATLLVIRCTE